MSPRYTPFGAAARRAAGFSLIEALVALVVLSVGLLGIAALYVTSVSTGRTASLRTQAVLLAADLADRIRANRTGGPTYDDALSPAGAINASCLQGGGGCTPTQMANEDKAEWLALVAARLPGATPTVTVVAGVLGVLNLYTITLAWVEPGIGNQGYTLSFQT